MKKFTKILISIVLIAVIAVTAVACLKKDASGLYILKTPKIVSMQGNTLEWNAVKHATGYEVVVDDGQNTAETTTVNSTTFTIGIDKKVTIKVRAIGDGEKYTFSEYSSSVEFDPPIALKSPDGVAFSQNEDKSIKITWNAVENASGYTVSTTLNGKATDAIATVSGTETTFSADYFKEAGAYLFTVKANGDSDKILDSKPSQSVTYTVTKQIANPTKVLISTSLNTGTISFNKVEYADRYIVRALLNGEEYNQVENVTIGSDIVSIDLSKFTFTEVGTYTFEVKAARKSGASAFYKESEWVKVNLKTDESKLCEMKVYPAPTNFIVEDEKLKWDAVEGAPKYTVEIKSNSNTYTAIIDAAKVSEGYDLSKSENLVGEGAENRAGGKVVYLNVYVPENLSEGILKGISTTDNIPYQSSIEPEIVDGYYQVKNLMHLAYMAKAPDKKYKLVNDINANSSYFFGLNATFTGEFDGNGKTLRNFYLVPAIGADNVSLFGTMGAEAVVKNLLIVDSKIDLANFNYIQDKKINAGFIAITNNGLIDNVNISSTISSSSSSSPSISTEGAFGGIALINKGSISNSATSFIASAHGVIGGITAVNEGKLFNVRTYGSNLKVVAISSVNTSQNMSIYDGTKAIAGGITAVNSGEISYSAMQENAKITAIANGSNYSAYAGGMVGLMTGGWVKNSYVSRQSASGSENAISASDSSATDYDNNSFSGGFVGVMTGGVIDHSYNHFVGAKATGTVGGFVGRLGEGASITNGYTLTSGNISARVIGGAVGVNKGEFKNFYYGKYETSKNKTIHASALGAVDGIVDVQKGEDMTKLNIEGFSLNSNVIGYMILSDMPYLDKAYNFRSASVSKNEDRKNIAKVYIGSTVVEKPTFEMPTTNTGFGVDKYEIASGELNFILCRVIQVA